MLKKIFVIMGLLLTLCSVEAKTLKIATLAPNGTTWMNEFRAAAKEISERTEKRVKLKFFPGGVMGSDKSVLRKMRIKQLQGGAMSLGAMADAYSGSQVYNLPFLFRSYEEVRAVRNLVDDEIRRGLDKKGYTLLGLSEGGFAYVMSTQVTRSIDQIRQQKVWGLEGDKIMAIMMDQLGVKPILLPISDVYTGLQTGLLDTVAINPTGAIILQWHTKIKYILDIPLAFVFGAFVVDKSTFKSLTKEDQAIVRDAVVAAFKRLDQQNRKDNERAREVLKDNNIKFIQPNEQELDQWKKILQDTTGQLVQEQVFPADLYDKIQVKLKALRAQQASSK